MRQFQRLFSLGLAILLAVAVCPLASAKATARLFNIYADGMLFRQQDDAVLSGVAPSGSTISCELKDARGQTVAMANATAENDRFTMSFTAPKGSYEEYTILCYENGQLFDCLERVVFGELWLASGQSNMGVALGQSITGTQMQAEGKTAGPWLRILLVPACPKYNGDTNNLPYEPQEEIPECQWIDGTDSRIFSCSAVGFFFAKKLQEDLQMPVGLLSDCLGGSSIKAWLSREAIDSDAAVRADMKNDYVTKQAWKEDGSMNIYSTMSGLYNKMIAPIHHFRLSGMIWYQGESDCSWDYGRYSRALELLQRSYSELFCHEGRLPLVFSQFANFPFGGLNEMQLMSAEFADLQAKYPDSMATVSISDVPLDYKVESQTCHPLVKKPIGERMAYAAEGLVYHKNNCYSAPSLQSTEVRADGVYLTFRNVGDGLVCTGSRIYGFTMCGQNGAYVPAEAQIVSKDTVRVTCSAIQNPKAVMFSQGLITTRSNLFSSIGDAPLMPVSPTVTDRNAVQRIWQDFGWTDCDEAQIWRCEDLSTAGFYDIWEAENANVSVTADSAAQGKGGLKIVSQANAFCVRPKTTYYNEAQNQEMAFIEFNTDWTRFGAMQVRLRNDTAKAVSLTSVRLYSGEDFFTAEIENAGDTGFVLPSDGQWHTVKIRLDRLQKNGKPALFTTSTLLHKEIADVEFWFVGNEAALSMDEICFLSEEPISGAVQMNRDGFFADLFNNLSAHVTELILNLVSWF